jgi:hypothetical protein
MVTHLAFSGIETYSKTIMFVASRKGETSAIILKHAYIQQDGQQLGIVNYRLKNRASIAS